MSKSILAKMYQYKQHLRDSQKLRQECVVPINEYTLYKESTHRSHFDYHLSYYRLPRNDPSRLNIHMEIKVVLLSPTSVIYLFFPLSLP